MAKAQVQPTNKELRAQAADLKASFNIGKQALTGKIIDSINEYLKVHELVKIKSTLASDKEALSFLAEEVAKGTKAQIIEKEDLHSPFTEKMKEQKNTNPKRIAVDVDDTLVESVTDFLAFLKIRKNIDVKKESFTTYYDNFAGMDKKEIDSLFLEFENTLDTFDFHDKATSTLQKLKEEGHELFVLTTRPTEIKEKTITLLEKEFGKNFFTDFYFSVEFGGSKARVYKEMNFDLLIDDADHHAKAVAEIGGNVLLFEQPWNKTMMEDPNIRRVKNWEEIGKLL